jgi:hypothetical protein
MAAWRSTTHRKTPRLSRRLASLAKNPSTALSHEQEVGVKWKVKRGWVEPLANLWMLVGGVVVEDHVHDLSSRHLRLNGHVFWVRRASAAPPPTVPSSLLATADEVIE